MDIADPAETAPLIQQVETWFQQLDRGDGESFPSSAGFDLAAACHGRMQQLDSVDRREAIRHAVAGARLIQALRRLNDPLPDWLDNQEEQLCRFGGMWIHELLLSSASDPEDLAQRGLELLRRLDRIHAGRHAWIHHQMSDLEQLLERPRVSTGSGIHYAIQDHGTGGSLPELVSLLAGPDVSIELSLDGTEAELARLQHVPNLQGGAISLRRSSLDGRLPPDLLRATTLALLQLSPALLNAYLDLESWADRYGRDGDGDPWREPLEGRDLLRILRHWDAHHGALGARNLRLQDLEQQLSRDQEERDLLLAHLHQLEVELDHYVAEHERLADLVGTIEAQMLRARRLLGRLENGPPAQVSGGGG
jgi:hypothetical protein